MRKIKKAIWLSMVWGCAQSGQGSEGDVGGGGGAERPVADSGAEADAGASAELDAGAVADAGGVSFDACLPAPTVPVPATCAGRDRLDEVLETAGLTRDAVKVSARDWSLFGAAIAHDAFRLPFYDAVHDNPLSVPDWAGGLTARLDLAAASQRPVASAIQVAASALGHNVSACATPPASAADEFVSAVLSLWRGAQTPTDATRVQDAAATLPADLAKALVPVLRAAVSAANARDRAFSTVSAALRQKLFVGGYGFYLPVRLGIPDLRDVATRTAITSGINYAGLYEAAASLAATVEAAALSPFAGARGFSFNMRTPLGRVVIRDAADHTYEADDPSLAGPMLLLVDTGGNDTYRIAAAANESLDNPVSILVDLAGNDTYAYKEVPSTLDGTRLPSDRGGRYAPPGDVTQGNGPISLSTVGRQGSGNVGIALLFDYGNGNDKYRSLRISQGFGNFGVGVLFDEGGDDTYEAEAGAQGAAGYGIGLLVDLAGNDIYRGYSMLQGFGWVRGAGMLYDRAGNDQYLADVGDPAEGGDPLYFTPQLPGKGNTSMAQGAGFGRRADQDGVYQSGGIGVLRDLAGNDKYQASVFGIGTGYWFGTGVLADGAGDDTYDGLWYVLGSAAHFALTAFIDEGGNDRYNQNVAPKATSIGVGHDLSVGWHIDLGGDDVYRAPGLSLGSGNVNGYGFFVNVGGNDTYVASNDVSYGAARLSTEANAAGNPRRERNTVGVFIDIGGTDDYRVADAGVAREGTTWRNNRDPDPTVTTEHGAGLDVADGLACPVVR
ncbi:MAG: hypothetical protein HYY84_14855 [Deltaproteobacteria bacterium]|nr:hypothetical protein [Deltaproteobacteria bacterium]